MAAPTYFHTQRACLFLLFVVGAALMVYLAFIGTNNSGPSSIILIIAALMMVVLALSFRQLTVADEGDRLGIRFGPLPLFHRSVRYQEIEAAAVGRTRIFEGWGIHYSVRGGWVWNLWGRDCVEVRLGRGRLWIGSDDAPNLARFLEEKIDQGRG